MINVDDKTKIELILGRFSMFYLRYFHYFLFNHVNIIKEINKLCKGFLNGKRNEKRKHY